MVSSFGLVYGNERTVREFLRIHPDEHPVSMQLFGHDAAVMREAAAIAADAGADVIDLNMGCPVRKVCKTGAGAALLDDPDKAVAIARRRGEGSGLPVTVKLRPGRAPGDRRGSSWRGGWSRRRASPASPSTRGTPRSSTPARPTTCSRASSSRPSPVPVILSGGLSSDEDATLRGLRARAAPPP